jgi:hypothetical protein
MLTLMCAQRRDKNHKTMRAVSPVIDEILTSNEGDRFAKAGACPIVAVQFPDMTPGLIRRKFPSERKGCSPAATDTFVGLVVVRSVCV